MVCDGRRIPVLLVGILLLQRLWLIQEGMSADMNPLEGMG